MQKTLITLAIIALATLGLWGAAGISLSHWEGTSSCPTIGIIPACYVVLICYGLILLSMYPRLKRSLTVFLIGWIPVITLASMGVIGEITSTLQCPASEIGIPKCYFSAALGLIIGLLYWRLYKARQNSNS